MSAQNQVEGELLKAKGEIKDTVGNPTEDFKQALGGIIEEPGGTTGQARKLSTEQKGRDIGELIKSIRESTDRLAENVRESAKSEMIIAGLLNNNHESMNKLADEVRGNAKREAITADQIRNIKESIGRLTEKNIRESEGETEMQGRQGEQHTGGQLQDTGGQATEEGTARISVEQSAEDIKTLVEHYMKSSEKFQEEVTKTAKRMQRGIRK